MSRLAIAVFAIIAAICLLTTRPVSAQSAAAGKDLFERRCTGCHALDREKEGPRLGNVYGRPSASVPNFEYSAGVKKLHVTWDAATLDKWLTDPEKMAPDTDMSFHLGNADERRAVIAYLKSLSGK